MSKENSRETKLKYIFTQNPKAKEFHVTSDDQAFTNESDAKNHAGTLEDKSIDLAKRSDHIKSKKAETSDAGNDDQGRETLDARHQELFGKLPAKNAKDETIKEKIAAEETRLAEEAKKDSKGDGSGEGDGTGE